LEAARLACNRIACWSPEFASLAVCADVSWLSCNKALAALLTWTVSLGLVGDGAGVGKDTWDEAF